MLVLRRIPESRHYGRQDAGKGSHKCVERTSIFFPLLPGPLQRGKIAINNPKPAIGESSTKANDMLARFQVVQQSSDFNGLMQLSDLVHATSLPTFPSARDHREHAAGEADIAIHIVVQNPTNVFTTAFFLLLGTGSGVAGSMNASKVNRGHLLWLGPTGNQGMHASYG